MLLVPAKNGGAEIDLIEFSAPMIEPPTRALSKKARAAAEKLAKKKGARNIAAKASPAEKNKQASAAPKKPVKLTKYTVRKGDTLASIARKFNIEVRDISKKNRVKAGIKPGQQLLIAAR